MNTSENLSKMVKDTQTEDPAVFSESELDIPQEDVASEEATPQIETVPITYLSTWFEQNCTKFDNINQVKVVIRGVNSEKTLIMAVKNPSGEKDSEGHDVRSLRVFENADIHPVLNLSGVSMDVYNNGFRIINEYQDGIFIKCYGVRTGLICVFCNNIDGKLIPYSITRVKKKDDEVEIVRKGASEYTAKLLENADLESLQLLYKQSSKAVDDLTTNNDVVEWLLARQNEVTDINHHLQIDNVLIDVLA